MADFSALYFNPASLFRFVDRTAQLAKSRDLSALEFNPCDLFQFVDRTASPAPAARVQFLNRGYHATSYTYYHWVSYDHIDSSGTYWPYGSSPPFNEISDVIGVVRIPTTG